MLTSDMAYVRQKYQNKKENAESRGIEFTLSIEKFTKLLNEKYCYYTGVKLALNKSTFNRKKGEGVSVVPKKNSITIDRVLANEGYHDDNVVACTREVNMAKNIIEQYDDIVDTPIHAIIREGIKRFQLEKSEPLTFEFVSDEICKISKEHQVFIKDTEESWLKMYLVEIMFLLTCFTIWVNLFILNSSPNHQMTVSLAVVTTFLFTIYLVLSVLVQSNLRNEIKKLKDGGK